MVSHDIKVFLESLEVGALEHTITIDGFDRETPQRLKRAVAEVPEYVEVSIN